MTMKCRFCGFDNEPAHGDELTDNCEGCGIDLGTALTGTGPSYNVRNYI